jgi:hypothetical protein
LSASAKAVGGDKADSKPPENWSGYSTGPAVPGAMTLHMYT